MLYTAYAIKKYTRILHDYSCDEIELVKMSQKRD